MKAQGQSIDDLPFQAILGVYGSWVGLIMCVLCVLAQLYVAIAPVGKSPNAYDFFVNMLALPLILAFFLYWKIAHKTELVRVTEMDLLTGRRELDLTAAKEEERLERATWQWWKKCTPNFDDVDV